VNSECADQRAVSEGPADNFATGSFFGLLGAEDGVVDPAEGVDELGAANLSAFRGLPPFISRSLST
jgi:hypothetical protein